jgi:hypothetical protein
MSEFDPNRDYSATSSEDKSSRSKMDAHELQQAVRLMHETWSAIACHVCRSDGDVDDERQSQPEDGESDDECLLSLEEMQDVVDRLHSGADVAQDELESIPVSLYDNVFDC